jgi:GTPase SAR1 family protein
MRLGLCGLPTSGKTTIFSALAGRKLGQRQGARGCGPGPAAGAG